MKHQSQLCALGHLGEGAVPSPGQTSPTHTHVELLASSVLGTVPSCPCLMDVLPVVFS